jgi:hypothetical protein
VIALGLIAGAAVSATARAAVTSTPAAIEAPHARDTSAGCRVTHYRILELPLRPVAIDDEGEVLGTTGEHRAAIWDRRSGVHELPLPQGFTRSEGVSINARGHAVALAFDSGFTRSRAFFVAGHSVTILGGEQARPFQLNAHDVIAGEALLPGRTRSEPVLWSAGAFPAADRGGVGRLEPRPLGACCGGAAKGIDDRGRVIGDAYDEQGRYYAFSWSEQGALARIERAHPFSSPVAMSRLGHAVIETFPGLLLYSPAGLMPLALPRRPAAHPRSLNDCDVIVGGVGPFADKSRAFAWDHSSGFVDLNARMPVAAGWKLETATGINNRGEIVGHGDPAGGDNVGFLLQPDEGSDR